jgi:hypothetical protein
MTQFTDLSITLLVALVTFTGICLVNFGGVYFAIAFFRRVTNV